MGVEDLVFNLKDVIFICTAVVSVVGFIWAIKSTASSAKEKIREVDASRKIDKAELEKKIKEEVDTIKDNQNLVLDLMREHKIEAEKKESLIYKRINDVRDETRDAHEKLSVKLDGVIMSVNNLSAGVSELTGYLKGKNEKPE